MLTEIGFPTVWMWGAGAQGTFARRESQYVIASLRWSVVRRGAYVLQIHAYCVVGIVYEWLRHLRPGLLLRRRLLF
ncbi:conserved protein of unknown function [Pseudomonas marincola]|uniref:Uncharacterized protein n=1 Tax=Pseudomonas marincola TaxID=437900 RepID=A0A653DY07_9PSED|nr:conserved protein of unknown function [Pseudomonas marincola]